MVKQNLVIGKKITLMHERAPRNPNVASPLLTPSRAAPEHAMQFSHGKAGNAHAYDSRIYRPLSTVRYCYSLFFRERHVLLLFTNANVNSLS